MASFARGLNAEDRIRTKLETYGCALQWNDKLDHKHKLDFVVTQFPDNQRFFSVGVQVTANLDNADKMREFWGMNGDDSRRPVQKAIYIELDRELSLEDGGAMAVFNVLTSFAFNRGRKGTVMGARIFADLTHEFFDIKQRIATLFKPMAEAAPVQTVQIPPMPVQVVNSIPAQPQPLNVSEVKPAFVTGMSVAKPAIVEATPKPERMKGFIHAYSRIRGIGFITGSDQETYFMHKSSVTDDAVSQKLNLLAYTEKPADAEIPVTFVRMGRGKPGQQYEAAGEIAFAYGS